MNAPIVRVYGLLLLLFAALVGFTSKWAVFDADDAQGQDRESPPADRRAAVKRGTIKTADGVMIAQSLPEGGGKHPVYVRRYPQGSLFGNPVGYSFVQVGQTGIERSENAALAGERNEFTSILDELRGRPAGGRQRHPDDRRGRAAGRHAGRCNRRSRRRPGRAASAARWSRSTRPPGAVKAMASVPGYDPNAVQERRTCSSS